MSQITDLPLDAPAIDHFRTKLSQARTDLIDRNRSRIDEALEQEKAITDEAEHAVFEAGQQFQLRLAGKDRKLLALIDHALDKIQRGDEGEFGLCEGTGEPIPRARLELRPWARYSVEHKMVLERERELHSQD